VYPISIHGDGIMRRTGSGYLILIVVCRRLNTSITTTMTVMVVAASVKGLCFLFTRKITNGNFRGGIYDVRVRHCCLQNKRRTALESRNILKLALRQTLIHYHSMYNEIYRIMFFRPETGNILWNIQFVIFLVSLIIVSFKPY